MLQWITDNLGTIIICAVLIGVVAAIIINMVWKKRSGKSSCCSGCAQCPMCHSCHKK